MKVVKNQILQILGTEGEKTTETELIPNREKFLSSVENALEEMSSITTKEDTAIDNVILRDLIRLENSASSGSVFLSGDCDPEKN